MASTPSQNNAFELMTTGEKSGQWGDITNVNMQIIDRATKGVGSIALTGSGDEITTIDYTASDGHYAVLVFSGTAGTVTINPNDQQKVFLVKNTTAGAVTITQGSGGNVAVAAGKSAIVYADGAGTGAAVVDVTSTFSLNLSTAGLTGTTAQFNAALSDNNFATQAGSETLTNKSVDLANNTLAGTLVQFNTALSDANFASLTGSETLTNKTVELATNTLSGTTAQFNAALSDNDFATLEGTETLTNKSVNLTNNTLTGTTAEFNTALSDDNFATLTGSETLTNKTLTSPSASNPTFTGAVYANGSSRGNITAMAALDVDCSAGNYFTKSVSTNSTFTFSNAPSSRAYGFMLKIATTGTPTITWPAAVEWPSDTEPARSANTTHLYIFMTDDGGTVWRGAALTDYAG